MKNHISRLRLAGWLEGLSLIALIFIAVPLKYIWDAPQFSKILGPVHGCLFLLFVFSVFQTAVEQRWKFTQTTWKVLLACLIPFGTFYVDRKILRKLDAQDNGTHF
ncbi:DUF3817 domain-containing protein [Flavobacterium selenitireducens]|uniref:DUF3817 domain-containing protein n=1 Tax=Flavobacterium selenitireducens TaxID=2722704 RepID=UPI00168B70DA|nr:DUF3817 domain-containing protein [Flavobacterium selenitireducens]MBD3582863.1 DUF3817 domain-containing protein [Flavobacterium selenitireducens]